MYFKDELATRLSDPKTLKLATKSVHQELTSKLANGGDYFLPRGVKYPFFFPDVTLEHPGVSVADVNGDGLEDIYVAMQHQTNLLFVKQPNGTFVESASEFGLDIQADSTCSIFADFDNDGDLDAFIGRGRHPSKYLVNSDGKFYDSKMLIDQPLPALVSSITATDFNGDGLLDVYLSTYSPIEAEYQNESKPVWAGLFLNDEQAQEFSRRQNESHTFLARTGPPNLLLRNTGQGKFVKANESKTLELWKMTFQAAWHDFDDDGDPDLYVANDYHQDNFFRNDGDSGFVDITQQIGLTEMGFAMGVSFGDYNNDGETDIYVSNMFSKAGQRILSQVDDVDPRFKQMAKGNFLYKKSGEGFEL
ncbi:MAG: VCBS repeat-containing protein, partial [Planctomycetota bacterium]